MLLCRISVRPDNLARALMGLFWNRNTRRRQYSCSFGFSSVFGINGTAVRSFYSRQQNKNNENRTIYSKYAENAFFVERICGQIVHGLPNRWRGTRRQVHLLGLDVFALRTLATIVKSIPCLEIVFSLFPFLFLFFIFRKSCLVYSVIPFWEKPVQSQKNALQRFRQLFPYKCFHGWKFYSFFTLGSY